jgi:hypothetical protein
MLDFDGVLHPSQGSDVPELALLPLLEEALSESACNIVISSTWREHYDLAALQGLLGRGVGPRVIEVLGPDPRGQHRRYWNIRSWLNANDWCADWRALDDSVTEFPPGCAELILCDGRTGMSADQVQTVRNWLAY